MKVENIINNWDPYSLFPFAPKDEYNNEIREIENTLKNEHNINKLELLLKDLFDESIIFDSNKKDYKKIVKLLLD